MIQPFAQDGLFLEDLARPDKSPGELRIWWLGQSGFLIRHEGSYLLIDPYLSDSLTEKYANTGKPHVRMTARVIDPARLKGIQVVTSSHNHTDHLDVGTLRPLFDANPSAQFIIPEANREFVAQRLGCEVNWPTGVDDGRTVIISGWQITGIAAAHNARETDAAGRHHFLGYIIRRGAWTLYHSGDTLRYPGMADKLSAYGVDVAFVPINGNKSERRVAGNLDGNEAAQLAHDIGAGLAIPHHFGMFEFNTADPEELFVPKCKKLAQPFRVLRAGEGLSLGSQCSQKLKGRF